MVEVIVHLLVSSLEALSLLDGLLHLLVNHLLLVFHVLESGFGDVTLDGELVLLRLSNQGSLLLPSLKFSVFSFAGTFIGSVSC